MNTPIIGYTVQCILCASGIREHVPTKRVCRNIPKKNARANVTCESDDILEVYKGAMLQRGGSRDRSEYGCGNRILSDLGDMISNLKIQRGLGKHGA